MKKKTVNFLFEAAALKRLERTGWQVLGGGNKESIAEHSFMVAVISFSLAKELKADIKKALMMSLFHDFAEARVGDIYKLSDLYVKADEKKAVKDAFLGFQGGDELIRISQEYDEEKTLEAKIVHDADTLALMIELKQMVENGNINAEEWFIGNFDALRLDESKQIAHQLENANSQDWWKRERQIIHKGYRK